MNTDKKIIRIKNLVKSFPIKVDNSLFSKKVTINAVDNISLDIFEGETLGILGESGCGKSSFGRTILQLYNQTSGSVIYNGIKAETLNPRYYHKFIENLNNNLNKFNMYHLGGKNNDDFIYNLTCITGGLVLSDNVDCVCSLIRELYMLNVEKYRIEKRLKDDRKHKSGYENVRLKYLYDRISKISEQISNEKESLNNMHMFHLYEDNLSQGVNLSLLNDEEMRNLRKDLQIVFQDPYSSLNQRMSIGKNIAQGLLAYKIYKNNSSELKDYVMDIMERCGLPNYMIYRYPYQFSEGQRQRVNIARALALNPKFVVCDGVVSSLDVSIQSQIINLLIELKETDNLTYFFISHNLNVVKYISDRIGVMYLGSMLELCDSQELFKNPLHPYTKLLVSSMLTTDSKGCNVPVVDGDMPSPFSPPSGCKFHTRCKYSTKICESVAPSFKEVEAGHYIACHLYNN